MNVEDTLDGEAVNASFRAARTIKGAAELFGLDHVAAFAHAAERVRDGRVAVQPALATADERGPDESPFAHG